MAWLGLAALLTTLAVPSLTAADKRVLSEIEFFGYKGLDLSAIRAALPFREGDAFPPPKVKWPDLKRQVAERVRQVIGRDPTDVVFSCCDDGKNFGAYIGLPGASYQPLEFNSAPTGAVRLPKAAVSLGEKVEKTLESAVMSGHGTEDDSNGYSLADDPKARQAQLAMRDYAVKNDALLLEVVSTSSDAGHRALAAQMLGYGTQSSAQIDALVHASLDPDDDVRDNATRALWVLAGAKPSLAQQIPTDPFIRLLRSGAWSDHNKSSLALMALTEGRDPQVLAQLRADALDSLLEIARWRSLGHASAGLTILGRIAGIDENTLQALIDKGDVTQILAKFAGE
jgi:hypothetical protein